MKTKRYNGKSMKHWNQMGREFVIDALLRAADRYGHGSPLQSLPQSIASKALMDMAMAYDAKLVKKSFEAQARMATNFAGIMDEIMGGGAGPLLQSAAHSVGIKR